MKKNLLSKIIIVVAISLSIQNLVIAQTGPAGVGNSAGNNMQPANELWLDASSLGLTNGDFVSNWLDKSGNNNNGEQINASSQPIYYDANQAGYNYPIVFFDGTDDFIPFDGNVIAGKDYTLFVVGQRRSNSYMKSVLMGGTNPGTNKDLHFHLTSAELRNHHYGNDLQSDLVPNTETYSSGTDINELGIFATRLASTESFPQRKSFQNNHYLNNISGSSTNAKLTSWNGAALARYDGGTAYYSELEIAEAIIFSSALNTAQLEIINNYLSEKYNIVIENDLYSAPVNFNIDVAGIGNRSNFKHSRSSSAGLYFYERDNTLDDGEFVFNSHNATENNQTNINTSTQVTASSAVAAWGREWYMAKTASASIDIQLVFDFKEAFTDGKYPQNIENYVLLWRANSGDDFTEISFSESGIADVDQVYFNVNAASFQNGYYTLGTKNETLSPLQGVNERTWYALKSGIWNDWETWTLDPSGNLPNNPSHEIPSDNVIDKVVIHSGKTIVVDIDDIINSQLTVDGRIDFAETKNHHFDLIKGTGRILLAEDNFPEGNATHFVSKGQGEGTVIFYGISDTLYLNREFYNLEIELSSDVDTLTLLNNYTLNGDLEINKGILKINNEDSTNILSLIVKGNFTIGAQGEIRTGKGKTIARNLTEDYSIIDSRMPKTDGKNYHSIYHQVEIWGDFTNNGIARFTNLDAPIYNEFAPNGVTVKFKGSSNTTAQLNGKTDFYNLIVDKGTDQTYTLNLYSSNEANFGLYGANNVGLNTSTPFSSSNPEVRKALFIQNGTLKLTGLLHIPTLTEGSEISGSGDYHIGQNAQLWLAGNVRVYATANDISTTGNTQVADASGASVKNGGGNQAMSVLGKFRISDGIFGTRESAGFIFWTSADAQVYVEGGEIYVAQLRSAGGGGGKASFKQTGGKIYLEGNNNGGEYTGDFPIFGLDSKDCVFQMSGGEIIIQDQDGDNDPELYIPSAKGNYYVTGGTIRFELPNSSNAQLFSNANLWNLELKNTSLTGNINVQLDTTLIITNDLTINPYTTLDVEDPTTAQHFNVNIGRNFSIPEDGTTTNVGSYLYKTNTTTFDGTEDGELYIGWRHDTDYEQNFYNLTINKPVGKQLLLKGDTEKEAANVGTNHLWFSRLIYVENNFVHTSGTFNQGKHSVRLFGTVNVSSKATCGVYENGITETNACLVFRGDGLSIQTEKGAVFGNIKIDVLDINNDEIAFTSDVYVKRIGYVDGKLNIGSNNLKIDYLHNGYSLDKYDIANGNETSEMIYTTGNASDGGLSLRIEENTVYGFPIGVSGKYTPAELTISSLIDTSYITIVPVNGALRSLLEAPNKMLNYYWRVSSDFITKPSALLDFHYIEADLVGINENSCRPGRIINYTTPQTNTSWDVVANSDYMTFNTLEAFQAGDYTMAQNNAFNSELRKLYARKNGLWHDPDTWSTTRDGSDPLTKIDDLPQPGDIVIIGNATTNFSVAINDETYNTYIATNKLDNAPINIAVLSILRYGGGESSLLTFGDSQSNREQHNFGVITNRDPDASDPEESIEQSSKLIFVGPGIPQGDFGEFITAPNTLWTYSRAFPGSNSTIYDESDVALSTQYVGSYTFTDKIAEYPVLQFEYSGYSGGYIQFPDKDIVVHNQIRFFKDHQHLIFNNGNAGDVTVEKDIVLNNGNSFNIEFQATGKARSLRVLGDINFNNKANSIFSVTDAIGTINHKLILHGNVINPSSSSDFEFYRANNKASADFEFQGESNSDFANMTDIPSFNQLIMNKGTDNTFSSTINSNFILCADTASFSTAKPIQLLNGNLILNHADIDLTLNSGNFNFNIPATAELQINQGTLRMEGDDTGIYLDGKLFLNGGNAYFNGAGNGNIFIEYSASRKAEIEITGGNLFLGGQIRRQLNTEEGVLKYIQTAGNVEIGTSFPKENNRGVFEILNEGSSFSFTGGNLTLAQSQPSPTIASFYFNPETLTLAAGSSIVFGSSNTITTRNSFGIYAGKALQNIEINNVSGKNPSLKTWTVHLQINEDLIIGDGTSFDANGIDLFIKQDLDNNGIFASNNNLTTFNGSGDQEIKGNSVTTFYKLTKPNSNTLRLQNAITVLDEFRIEAGNFEDNSFTATLKGNVYNVATHTYGGSGDGILLKSDERQYISGSGTYGKLSIENPYGIQLNVGYNLLINNMLKLKAGVFNIGGNLLTIAKSASIFPENPFSASNMIETNISFTDNGVKKYFAAGSGEFVYPIGAGGKYTPVKVIAISNPDENGFLIAKASNERHPSIQEDVEAPENVEIPDTANVLQYYWSLTSEDFTDVSGNVEFYYDPIDTLASNAFYNISDYIPARLLESSNLWNKYSWEDFDEVAEKIVFKFEDIGSAEISGDYTAGIQPDTALLKGAIPDMVATYETVASGDWSDGTIWSPEIPGGPRGAIVIINPDHTVVSDKNYALTHRIEINGRLETENTFGNRLGLVSGTGTLSTESGLLPAGFYNKFFFAKSGGTLEYTGTTNYDALNNLAQVNNVRFSGTGDRRLPNLELRLVGSLWIDGDDASLKVINEYDNKLTVDGDIILGTGSFDAGTGDNAILELGGTEPQTISGNFTDDNSFNTLRMNNTQGANLTSTIHVDNKLDLNAGIIKVLGTNKLVIRNASNTAIIGGDCSNYVSGILSKLIDDNDGFVFPVGKSGRCGFAEVMNTQTSSATYWDLEYFNEPADNGGMSTDAFSTPLTFISKSEYWRVESAENSAISNLKLYWDDLSGISTDEIDQNDTRIVKWTTGTPDQWISNSIEDEVNHTEHTISTLSAPTITYAGVGNSNYFTFSTTAILPLMTWTGLVSENWEDAGNWDTGKIPYSAADVLIPNVGTNFYPRIRSEASCKLLTIEENSNLWVMPDYGLRANGETTINGEFVLADNYTSTGQFIDNGTITTGPNAIIHAHHWLPANKYSYISSPLAAAVRDTFNNHYGPNPNFYKYVETNDDGLINGIDNNWMDGWEFGDATLEVGRGYASGWPGRGTFIKFQGGSFNTGDISINVTNSNQAEFSDGWNLVGNPYPSAIDATSFVLANSGVIDGALYFWDDDGSLGDSYSSGDYATWNLAGSLSGQTSPTGEGSEKIPDGFIGMAQGFFVKASNIGTNPLNFTNNMRTFGNGQFFNTKKTVKTDENIQRIRLNMQNDKYYNELLLTFTDLASDSYDNLYDARKMKTNSNLSFYSILHNEAFSIQSQSTISSEKEYKAIPIGYEIRESGDYSIRLREIENISHAKFIYLDDKEARVLTDLRTDSLYSFSAKAGENKSRFEIVFSNKALTYDEIEVESDIQIYSYDKNVVIEINTIDPTEGEVQIVNLSGQVIESRSINNDYYFNIPVNAIEGIYLVKVINNQKVHTEKVFIK